MRPSGNPPYATRESGDWMGGKLERPVLPPYLYRYRSLSDDLIDQEIEAITDQYPYCSAYRSMNDPMEGFYEPTARFQKDTEFRRAVREILDAKRNIGICCFSDTHDNELMWTHYASNYRGICIGYRPQPLLDAMPNDSHLVRLGYGAKPPKIGSYAAHAPETAALRILSHKKANWVYEREWRVLWHQGKMPIPGKGIIRELRLGSRIKDDHRNSLLAAFAHAKISNLRNEN